MRHPYLSNTNPGAASVAALLLLLSTIGGCCAPRETPLPVEARLAVATGAHSVEMERFLWSGPGPVDPATQPDREPSLSDETALFEYLCEGRRDASSERVVAKMLAGGALGYAAIEVTPTRILLGGREVLALDGGEVPDHLRKGSLITPLYDPLQAAADDGKGWAHMCGDDFEGEILLLFDGEVPWTTVKSVLYTAGQAQFDDFLIAVEQPDAPDLGAVTGPRASDRLLTIFQDTSGAIRVSGLDAGEPVTGPLEDLGPLTAQVLGSEASVGCAIVVPHDDHSWATVAHTLDRVGTLGASKLTLAGGIGDDTPGEDGVVAPAAELALAPGSIGLADRVSVIRIELPRIGKPGDLEAGECLGNLPAGGGRLRETTRGEPIPPGGDLFGGGGLAAAGATRDEPMILGAVDRSAIDGVIGDHMAKISDCSTSALSTDMSLTGRVRVKFVISKNGSVSSAKIRDSTLDDPTAEACITRQISAIQFPEPRGGGIAIVTYPFSY